MSPYRLLLRRSLRHSATAPSVYAAINHHPLLPPHRNFAFSSAEEAAAERRRRKRHLRFEPPLHALQRNNHPPPRRDPNAPRLPDSTSALVGPRLSLHNRVQSLIRAGDLDAASTVARNSLRSRTRPTVFTCNAVVAAMLRAKRFDDAIKIFQFFFNHDIVPNIVSYNNLINTYCDQGSVDSALQVYRRIIETASFAPSAVTYRHLTKGLVDAGRIGEAMDLLREMLHKGHCADSLVYNNLISGFLNLENLDKASELFDELKERCAVYDGVVNATFMDWFFNRGREKEAMESYKSLLDCRFKMIPATCNTLLKILLKHGKKEAAWELFHQMLDNHTPPNFHSVNSDTFNIMVNECFKLGQISEGLGTFRKSGTKLGAKPFAMDVAGYNNIIARMCENGMLSEAEQMFGEMSSRSLTPDVTTYRTLIDAFLEVERIDDALRFFHKMVKVGLRVVASFGNSVFDLLIENGRAKNCAEILTKMGEKDLKPDVSCYVVVIRGLCKEAELDTSLELLGQMNRYGIAVTPELREFVNVEFRKAGRCEEVERMLAVDRQRSVPNYQPPRPPRQASPRPSGHPQMEETRQVVSPTEPHFMAGRLVSPPSVPSHMVANELSLPWGPQMKREAAKLPPEPYSTPRNATPPSPRSAHVRGNVALPPWGSPQMERQAALPPPESHYTAPELSIPSRMAGNAAPSQRMPPQVERQAISSSLGSHRMNGNALTPQWVPTEMDRQATPLSLGPHQMNGNTASSQWGMERKTVPLPTEFHHMDRNAEQHRWGPPKMDRKIMPPPPQSHHMNGIAVSPQWGMGRPGMPFPIGPRHIDGNAAPPQWGHIRIERQAVPSQITDHMDGNVASPTFDSPQIKRRTMPSPPGPHHMNRNIAHPPWRPPQMDRQGVSPQLGSSSKEFNAGISSQEEGEEPAMFSYPKSRSWLYTFLITSTLICAAYYIGNASISKEYKQRLLRWDIIYKMSNTTLSTYRKIPKTTPSTCQNQCKPIGTEALPEGILSKTSDLEMRPLWDPNLWHSGEAKHVNQDNSKPSKSLLAMAVGIKQKRLVDEIVKKFIYGDFAVMLFHYDGIVNEWNDLAWNNLVLHVRAMNQTKWWFAKRFLHPDVVAEYNYIFVWDEDLGVEHFHPGRYLSIVKDEGLEISQPALDPVKSEVHHPITSRQMGSKVHRNYHKSKGSKLCDDNSIAPPCIGWVELMAPVFSRAAWRCAWYMIQSDLIHAWGLDYQLGYCAQGDRTRNVGVVDSEYIVHLAVPTLGALPDNEAPSKSHKADNRIEVRIQSAVEMEIFRARWKNATEDRCWIDPFQQTAANHRL